ncbi:neuropeptide S receptor-like [Saccostrea echinata]|uniref:neuropeptide S receptor-like n=1 Tax=Saccostrea echinata TaxID=191078 RepID=UPI002A8108CF|nr:neuropeptide S receptor-like [Saccostrea echinata]
MRCTKFWNDSFAALVGNANQTSDCDEESSVTVQRWTGELIIRVASVMAVMIFTLIGNFLLIALLTYKKSRRRKRVNIFIINLAIGDLAVAFITMSTEIIFLAFNEWVLGPFLCKFAVYLQCVTLSSATFLLTGMSVDRYQVIVKPMQSLAKRPKIWTKVVSAWVLAFLFALPQLAIFVEENQIKNGKSVKMCLSHGYTAQWQRKVYFSFLMTYVLVVPSMVMLFCYYKIAKVVWARASSHQHSIEGPYEELKASPRVSVRTNLVSASKQKVIKMTLTVIVGFLVCLTPYFIISFLRIYSDYKLKLEYALSVSEIIFMVHSALNPVLYGIFALRWEHIKSFHSRFKYRKSIRDEIAKQRAADRKRFYKLQFGLTIFKRRELYHDTSFIIANHPATKDNKLQTKATSHTIKNNFTDRRMVNHEDAGNLIEHDDSIDFTGLSSKTSRNGGFRLDVGSPV